MRFPWRKPKKEAAAPHYDVVASLLTDTGCVRELNEDSGRCIRPDSPELLARKGLLAVVADGMGGHAAGEVASQLAVDEISRGYYEERSEPLAALKQAFCRANRRIYEAGRAEKGQSGMGTTCTALVVRDAAAFAAHVGDSRLYLLRHGGTYLMTEDHSQVMEWVRQGVLSREEARHHEDRNVILRALGTRPDVEVSTWAEPFPVRSGDRFLLCSDGLHDLVEEEEMQEAVNAGDPPSACQSLVALARERGGHDNITVAILRIEPAAVRETASAARPVPVDTAA